MRTFTAISLTLTCLSSVGTALAVDSITETEKVVPTGGVSNDSAGWSVAMATSPTSTFEAPSLAKTWKSCSATRKLDQPRRSQPRKSPKRKSQPNRIDICSTGAQLTRFRDSTQTEFAKGHGFGMICQRAESLHESAAVFVPSMGAETAPR